MLSMADLAVIALSSAIFLNIDFRSGLGAKDFSRHRGTSDHWLADFGVAFAADE